MGGVHRRMVLGGAVALAAVSVVPRAHAKFTVQPLAGGFTLLTGGGGNVLVRSTDAGAILVDSGSGDAGSKRTTSPSTVSSPGSAPSGPSTTTLLAVAVAASAGSRDRRVVQARKPALTRTSSQ